MWDLHVINCMNNDIPIVPTDESRKRKPANRRYSLLRTAAIQRYGKTLAQELFPRMFESTHDKDVERIEMELERDARRMDRHMECDMECNCGLDELIELDPTYDTPEYRHDMSCPKYEVTLP